MSLDRIIDVIRATPAEELQDLERLDTLVEARKNALANSELTRKRPRDEAPPLPLGVQVELRATGQRGVIVCAGVDGVDERYCVSLYGVVAFHEPGDFEIVRPSQKRDAVVVLEKGVHFGQAGTLLGIDGADGIVKLTVSRDIKILKLERLGRTVGGGGEPREAAP
jgi:hypothetical protein